MFRDPKQLRDSVPDCQLTPRNERHGVSLRLATGLFVLVWAGCAGEHWRKTQSERLDTLELRAGRQEEGLLKVREALDRLRDELSTLVTSETAFSRQFANLEESFRKAQRTVDKVEGRQNALDERLELAESGSSELKSLYAQVEMLLRATDQELAAVRAGVAAGTRASGAAGSDSGPEFRARLEQLQRELLRVRTTIQSLHEEAISRRTEVEARSSEILGAAAAPGEKEPAVGPAPAPEPGPAAPLTASPGPRPGAEPRSEPVAGEGKNLDGGTHEPPGSWREAAGVFLDRFSTAVGKEGTLSARDAVVLVTAGSFILAGLVLLGLRLARRLRARREAAGAPHLEPPTIGQEASAEEPAEPAATDEVAEEEAVAAPGLLMPSAEVQGAVEAAFEPHTTAVVVNPRAQGSYVAAEETSMKYAAASNSGEEESDESEEGLRRTQVIREEFEEDPSYTEVIARPARNELPPSTTIVAARPPMGRGGAAQSKAPEKGAKGKKATPPPAPEEEPGNTQVIGGSSRGLRTPARGGAASPGGTGQGRSAEKTPEKPQKKKQPADEKELLAELEQIIGFQMGEPRK